MTEGEKYRLSLYQTVEVVHETDAGRVEKVVNSLDGLTYIKKTYPADRREVFRELVQIESDYLPKVHEFFFGEDTIVIEQYIEGVTLQDKLTSGDCLSESEIRKYFEDVCHGLLDLHTHGIIHRDIKPGNIIVDASDKAYLIDFSIARVLDQQQEHDTECFGTIGYAAPEQYGFSQSDYRSDIYALGNTMNKIVGSTKISKRLRILIDRCLLFDPNQRIQNCTTILKRLQKKRKARWVVLSIVVIGICASLFLVLYQGNKENKSPVSLLPVESSRIVMIYTPEVVDECIRVEDGQCVNGNILLGGEKPISISTQLNEKTMTVDIENSHFELIFDSDISTQSYDQSRVFGELFLWDMNQDGTKEILAILADGLTYTGSDGDHTLLNGSSAWVIYQTGENTYDLADGNIITMFDFPSIYDAQSGCVWGEFPLYYQLQDGKLVERDLREEDMIDGD